MKATLHRVSDIADQIRGVTYRKQDASTSPAADFLPVLRAGNITDEGLTYNDLVYVPSSKISAKQMVRKDDIVIAASSGSINIVGKAARALEDFEGGFGAFCKILRPNKNVNPAYFSHFFKTTEYRQKVSFLAEGASINNLRNEDLNGLQIPLPPLSEQKRIAKILDATDALRTKRREALAQLDSLLQSTFLEMFGDPVTNPMGWGKAKIEDIGSVQGGLQVTSKRHSLPIERPYLRVANVYRGYLNLDEIKTIRMTEAEECRTTLKIEDILFVEGHGNKNEIGRCARWDGSIEQCVHQNHLIRLRCDQSKILHLYAENYMNSEGGRRGLIGTSRTTSGLNTISVSKVKLAAVALPPINLQRKFVAIVESVERQKAKQQAHLSELDTLFAALQQRAFNGDL